ncbi:MAG: hypothetical protein ACTHNQ_18075 [Microbacterium sp.]|uniref:hypothetical protein n=1 Tax=Microbacterium sp. TaxID=51671 RepID=UPI003F80277D
MSDDDALDRLEQQSEKLRLQIAHTQAQLYDRKKQQAAERRRYAREYYARNREKLLEDQRRYRAAQRERDPERYQQLKRERTHRWYARHRDEQNARQRARYQADPEAKKQRRARHYAEHAEEIKARRRERYAANREVEAEKQRARRDQDKRRRDAGLPAARLRRVSASERAANDAAAEQFFGQRWPSWMKDRLRHGPPTPPQLLAAFERECARARAAHYLAEQRDELARLRSKLDRTGPHPRPATTPQELRIAQQEAIGKAINDRLRHRDPPRRPHHNDPAAPRTIPAPAAHPTGMNR